MHLRKGKIPGVKELSHVGGSAYESYRAKTMQQRYNAAMKKENLGKTDVVVASLTISQREGIKCLKKNGFKQVGAARRNPNSGNRILLFAKFITKNKKRGK